MIILFTVTQLQLAEPGFELTSSKSTTLSSPTKSGFHRRSTVKLHVVLQFLPSLTLRMSSSIWSLDRLLQETSSPSQIWESSKKNIFSVTGSWPLNYLHFSSDKIQVYLVSECCSRTMAKYKKKIYTHSSFFPLLCKKPQEKHHIKPENKKKKI